MMTTNFKKKKSHNTTEKILKYRNRLNGDILYSSSNYKTNIIDGVEFLLVFTQLVEPNLRRTNWMRKDNLEKVIS